MGKRWKQSANGSMRARGKEPEPGDYAGVKNCARYISRTPRRKMKIKNPERYLHSSARLPWSKADITG